MPLEPLDRFSLSGGKYTFPSLETFCKAFLLVVRYSPMPNRFVLPACCWSVPQLFLSVGLHHLHSWSVRHRSDNQKDMPLTQHIRSHTFVSSTYEWYSIYAESRMPAQISSRLQGMSLLNNDDSFLTCNSAAIVSVFGLRTFQKQLYGICILGIHWMCGRRLSQYWKL